MKLIPLKDTVVFNNSILVMRKTETGAGVKTHFFSIATDNPVVDETSLRSLLGSKKEVFIFLMRPAIIKSSDGTDLTFNTVAAINIAYFNDRGESRYTPEVSDVMDGRWSQLYSVDIDSVGKGFLEEGMLVCDHTLSLFKRFWETCVGTVRE